MLLLNILLTIIWLLLTLEVTIGNVLFGFAISSLIIGLTERGVTSIRPTPARTNYLSRTIRFTFFLGFFFVELVKASIEVLLTVLNPSLLRPGVIAIPLDLTSASQITLLGNLITLTPGTLTLDVSTDKKVIYVHSIRVDDPDAFRQEIKEGFERRILDLK